MKNVMVFLSIFSLIVLFSACQKDGGLEKEEIAQIKQEQTAGHIHSRSCSMESHMKVLMANPEYAKQHRLKLEKVNSMPETRSANCNDPAILPVAIHFQGVSNPDIACLRALAQSQVQILNDDYQGNNSDISTWTNTASNSFPGVSNGEGCFELCIATKNHPSGYGLSEGDLAVTVNTTNGDNDSNWSGYINIFVQSNTGVLGYSPLGGSGNGDGVVIDATAFGSGAGCAGVSPNAPYNLGRTLTHELGHYLLLDHIWGGGCGSDDAVGDTPDSANPYYGCPNIGDASCNSTDMHMNYMDYTNDACMYMFSAGQVTRSENYINSSLQNVVNNAANVCGTGGGGGGNDPTCTDGIMNGNETGVDCGGPDCEPCTNEPTCEDGIMNGNETGVDCGGPDCEPCTAEPTCEDGIMNGNETGVDCGGPDCQPCETQGACDIPTQFDAIPDVTTADVTWNVVAAANKYRIKYRPVGTTGSGSWTGKTAQTNAITLINLLPDTDYEYRVRSICSDGEKSAFSPKQYFTTLSEGGGGSGDCENGTQVDLELTLDDYGSETTWYLVDDYNYEIVAEGGPYEDGINGAVIDETFCLEDGCYYFAIFDDYGDGICCDWGDGSYALSDASGTAFAESDGYFGSAEYVDFCVENGEIEVFFFKRAQRNATQTESKIKGETTTKTLKRSVSQINNMKSQVK